MTAKSIKHAKTSGVADGGDSSLVLPSDWNSDHNFYWGWESVTGTTDTIAHADNLTYFKWANASGIAVTLPAPSGGNFPLGWSCAGRNAGAGNITITGSGGGTINGAASIIVYPGQTIQLWSSGTVDYSALVTPVVAPPLFNGGAGRLTRSNATTLLYGAYNGDSIKINGVVYTLPFDTITGLGNTSVFVNGTGGQNLAANTLYYVYAFINSGVITADFRTGAHVTDTTAGNVGVEVLTGPTSTRTLIGLVRTNASSQFVDTATQRFVRSWHNAPATMLTNWFTASRFTTSASVVEINTEIRIEWVHFSDETIRLDFQGIATTNSVVNAHGNTSIGIDGTTKLEGAYHGQIVYADGFYQNASVRALAQPAEGYHYATLLGNSNGSAAYIWTVIANSAGDRPTLNGYIAPR